MDNFVRKSCFDGFLLPSVSSQQKLPIAGLSLPIWRLHLTGRGRPDLIFYHSFTAVFFCNVCGDKQMYTEFTKLLKISAHSLALVCVSVLFVCVFICVYVFLVSVCMGGCVCLSLRASVRPSWKYSWLIVEEHNLQLGQWCLDNICKCIDSPDKFSRLLSTRKAIIHFHDAVFFYFFYCLWIFFTREIVYRSYEFWLFFYVLGLDRSSLRCRN